MPEEQWTFKPAPLPYLLKFALFGRPFLSILRSNEKLALIIVDAKLTDRFGNNQIHWQIDPVMIRCTDRQDQEINVLYDGMTPERRVDLLISCKQRQNFGFSLFSKLYSLLYCDL